jgi:hypothetical protein
MSKKPTTPPRAMHSWTVFHLKGMPAQFVGIIRAPDANAAIQAAIKEHDVPANARDRLMAVRR